MPSTSDKPHMAERLKRTVKDAEKRGFEVRKVLLDQEAANWCQIGSRKVIFLDLAAGASEQLEQLSEILNAHDRISRVA